MNPGSPEERFRRLYDEYEPNIYAYCRRRFPVDVAEDVLSDVLLTVWRRIEDVPAGDQTLPWLYRVAQLVSANRKRSILRRRNLESRLEALGVSPSQPIADQIVVREEVRSVVEALEGLPPHHREILKLSVWEHLSAKDIATVLAISPEAVTQRLHRARRRLEKEHRRKTESRTAAHRKVRKGGEQ